MPTFDYENQLRKEGCKAIAGIDEVGRGPLAGPVTAAAVILPPDYDSPLLNDSKKLTAKRREALFEELTSDPRVLFSVISISEKKIDQINILEATRLAMRQAAQALSTTPDHCLIDGLPVPHFPTPSTSIIKGDQKSLSISAASIIAKVTRDRYLLKMAKKWPAYGFEKHKGYGTKIHLAALQAHGPCPIHRQTFKPVAQYTR